MWFINHSPEIPLAEDERCPQVCHPIALIPGVQNAHVLIDGSQHIFKNSSIIDINLQLSYPVIQSQHIAARPFCLHEPSQITACLISFCGYASNSPCETSDVNGNIHDGALPACSFCDVGFSISLSRLS